MPRNPNQTAVLSISIPVPLARMVEQARKTEHRTRSGVVSEALRHYFARVEALPEETASLDELRAFKRGRAEAAAGKTTPYEQYRAARLDRQRSPKRAKAAR